MVIRTLFRKLFSPSERHTFASLTNQLGYQFRNQLYLKKALTHPSLDANSPSELYSYQRLEYLGDAVLELIISEYLFLEFPADSEGELTERRASLVNQSALASIGKKLDLSKYIRSQQIAESPIERSEAVLSDVVEAILGAIYLDGGYQTAQTVVHRLFPLPKSGNGEDTHNEPNYKGDLIEYCHAEKMSTPIFKTMKKSGPDHSRIYTIGVQINGIIYGTGKGSSKKKAGQRAARLALENLTQEKQA